MKPNRLLTTRPSHWAFARRFRSLALRLGALTMGLVASCLVSSSVCASDVHFALQEKIADFADVKDFDVGDVDQDGDADILVVGWTQSWNGPTSGRIGWLKNVNGDNTAWEVLSIDDNVIGAQAVRATDMDGDGDLDALVVSNGPEDDGSQDFVAWWENVQGDGSAWAKHLVGQDQHDPHYAVAGDIDGDGDMDIAVGASAGGEIIPDRPQADGMMWFENTDGHGLLWTSHRPDPLVNGGRFVALADMDGDGDTDIVNSSPLKASDGFWRSLEISLMWWENTQGDGSVFEMHTILSGDTGHTKGLVAEDMDGDGDLDVVACRPPYQGVAWWENADGGGVTWTKHTVGELGNNPGRIYVADMNADGAPDIMGGNGVYYQNMDGMGLSWQATSVLGGQAFTPGDLDGDGDLDLIGMLSHTIAWWESLPGPTPTEMGPPVLESVVDYGPDRVWLDWSNDVRIPHQLLGFAYDLYANDWVNVLGDSMWAHLDIVRGAGAMSIKQAGGYIVWVANQYAEPPFFYPCLEPKAVIVATNPPHAPLAFTATDLGARNVRLDWAPEHYGTFLYWVIALNLDTYQWVAYDGPLGNSFWQYVVYGTDAFTNGSVDLTMPDAGTYSFFLFPLAWDGVTFGEQASAIVPVAP